MMLCSAARNTAPATSLAQLFARPWAAHAAGWLLAALLAFTQPRGRVAADTKHDLAANPAGFLAGAAHAWTDTFTLGQLQNQAYGYLFPQGAFFALSDALPDWVAQRAWWTLVLGVGLSGALALARRVGLATAPACLAAAAFALSPRTLTTLTAISSETWPVMLAPWVVLPFLPRADGTRSSAWRTAAAATLPVACMGAVNATATLAACVPAALVALVYHRRALLPWLAGCALVSVWWIGPLLILGRYAPPFTDYIESSFVTTRWLNLAEILRGTTSWSPFVDNERLAGTLLATEPFFVLVTALVSAVGLAGLTKAPRVWTAMLLVGVAVLGCHYAGYLDFLDGSGAALRNVHKFDPLVRLPLALGIGFAWAALSRQRNSGQRATALVAVALVVGASASPAFTGRLLPRGAYEAVPQYWQDAADFLNAHAQGTRTLFFPERSFAREDWGWTRDEPLQPLLDVPWAVRDAIPLVPPEAIRGLDGVMAALQAGDASGLTRLGIGALVVRNGVEKHGALKDVPGEVHSFGDVGVILLNERPDMLLGSTDPVRVAGGGESLAFLPGGPYSLVDADADVVTDTPLLVDRNFGTLDGPVSAPLTADEPTRSHNAERDYPSAGPRVTVEERGGHVRASSSAADANALGGARPARSVSAAVDGEDSTAWWPAPGDTGWLELEGEFPARSTLTLTATAETTVTVRNGDASVDVKLGEEPTEVRIPGGAASAVRVELHERVGLANAQVEGHEITRTVVVPDSSPKVRAFLFQRAVVDTGVLIREFTAPRDMSLKLDADRPVDIDGETYEPGATVPLDAGTHELRTRAKVVRLGETDAGAYTPTGRDIAAADTDRLLVTTRAFNKGLRGYLGDTELEPREIDAASQAFVIPAGAAGSFRMEFAGERAYRLALLGGGSLALLTVAGCLLLLARPRRGYVAYAARVPVPLLALAALAAAGPAGLAGGIGGFAAARWTTLRPSWLSAGLMATAGLILARGPWGSGHYAGDFWLLAAFAGASLGALAASHADAGTSTQ